MHTARARGPDRAVAVEGVVPPADPASVLGGYPLQGFSVAASAAVEVPLIGVGVEFFVSEFEAALLALLVTITVVIWSPVGFPCRRTPPKTLILQLSETKWTCRRPALSWLSKNLAR